MFHIYFNFILFYFILFFSPSYNFKTHVWKNTAIERTVEFLKLDFNWPIAKDFAEK